MSNIIDQLRLESEEKYRSPDEVTKKWFKEYGRISSQNTFEENRGILQEAFNLIDTVASNKLADTILASVPVDKQDSKLQRFDQKMIDDPHSDFYERNGRIYCVRKNQYNSMSFYSKIDALGFAGIISRQTRSDINNADFSVRLVRNGNSHINATIMEKTINLDVNTLRALIGILGKALVEMGMLSSANLTPSYEELRIHSGSLVCKRGYKVEELIGEGGSGRVYLGIKLNTQAKVAIKELKPNSFSAQMFSKEREILVKLQHNMIPVIYEAFDENCTYYIIMQYIDGITLDRAFENVTDPDTALKASIEICGLVQYLQNVGEGLIHGDIKPQNMIVDKAGSIHLVDFGTADSQQMSDYTSGSAVYTAPELIGSGIRMLSSDVYSIGMLMSQVLFAKCSMSESYHNALSDIIMKATSSEPQLRYQSASKLLAALEQVKNLNEATNRTTTKTTFVPTYNSIQAQPIYIESQKRNPVVLIVASICAICFFIVLIIILNNKGTEKPSESVTTEQQEYMSSQETHKNTTPEITSTPTTPTDKDVYVAQPQYRIDNENRKLFITASVVNTLDSNITSGKAELLVVIECSDGSVTSCTFRFVLSAIAAHNSTTIENDTSYETIQIPQGVEINKVSLSDSNVTYNI